MLGLLFTPTVITESSACDLSNKKRIIIERKPETRKDNREEEEKEAKKPKTTELKNEINLSLPFLLRLFGFMSRAVDCGV